MKLEGINLAGHENVCVCSYTYCVVLAVIALTISIAIGAYFAYKYLNRNKENVSRYDYFYQATNHQFKREVSNKLILKMKCITFLVILLILKILIQAY